MKNILISLLLVIFSTSCVTSWLRNMQTIKKFDNYILQDKQKYNDFIFNNVVFIPTKFGNYPDTVYFQLDLGTSTTVLYEKELTIMLQNDSIKKDKITQNNGWSYYLNPTIKFSNEEEISCQKLAILRRDAPDGFRLNNDSLAKTYVKNSNDLFVIGTLGYDLIINKIIILDYHNNIFSICNNITDTSIINNTEYIKGCSIEKFPITIKSNFNNKRKRFLFDTGTAFELVIFSKDWNKIPSVNVDTLEGNYAWGKEIQVIKKCTKKKIEIGNNTIENLPIYTINSINNQKFIFKLLRLDGIIGNPLFNDKTIIIDNKNNKFGILK